MFGSRITKSEWLSLHQVEGSFLTLKGKEFFIDNLWIGRFEDLSTSNVTHLNLNKDLSKENKKLIETEIVRFLKHSEELEKIRIEKRNEFLEQQKLETNAKVKQAIEKIKK